MLPGLDSLEMPARRMEYMIENPKRVIKMNPDDGGGGRGFNAAFPGNESDPGAEEEETHQEESAGQESGAQEQKPDGVNLSPEAMKNARTLATDPESGQSGSPAPVDSQGPHPAHINITA